MEDPVNTGKVLIKIILINEIPYVWDASDYVTLRKEHRMCGILDGASPLTLKGAPKSRGFYAHFLPARLTKVEAYYLVKHRIALAFRVPALNESDPDVPLELINDLKSRRRIEQVEAYKQQRRLVIESMIDKIIEGKRKRGRGPVPDRNTVLEEETQKIVLPYETTQIDLADPWVQDADFVPCDIPMPDTLMDKLKYMVFEDFHLRRKYFVTGGLKFGGDFLAYPGDPEVTHSEFIIMCHDTNRGPLPPRIGTFVRLANTVKKILLVAFLDQNKESLKYKIMNSLQPTAKEREAMDDANEEDIKVQAEAEMI